MRFSSTKLHTMIAALLLGSFFVVIFEMVVKAEETLAAPNLQINYQGKLTDASDVAVPDGSYNMRFWLLTSPTVATTSAVWSESLTAGNKVTVTNGLFSIMLGSTSPLTSVDFNQTLYLGVEIGGSTTPAWDGEMSPRKILGTVPAAFEADRLDGLTSSQFVRTDAASTIATSSASTLLTLTQNGAGDILNLFDGTAEVFSILDGGFVGVGTSSPMARFAVAGNAFVGGSLTATGTASFAGLTVSASSTLGYASSSALTVSGNSFLNALTVSGNTSLAAATSTNFNATEFGVGSDYITDLTGSGLSIVGGALTAAGDGASNWLYQNGRLSPSTTVGIGIFASSTIGNGTATGGLTVDGGATTTGNQYIAGNLGLGARSSHAKLTIQNTAGSLIPLFDIATTSGSATSSLFTVLANGNVGINTAAPAYPLQVNGTTRIYNPLDTTRYLELSHNTNTSRIIAESKITIGASDGTFITGGGSNAWTGSTVGLFRVGGLLTKLGSAVGQVEDADAGNTNADAYISTSKGYDASGRRDANKIYFITPNGISPAASDVNAGNGGDIYFKSGAGGTASGSGVSGRNGRVIFQRVSESNTLGDFVQYLNTSGTVLSSITSTGGSYFGGSVGVGTSSPWAKLSIQETPGSQIPLFSIASTTNSAYATTSLFTVLANGNVGIGTSTPGYALTMGSGQIAAASGLVTAPSLTFAGAPTSGLYMSDANGFSITATGVKVGSFYNGNSRWANSASYANTAQVAWTNNSSAEGGGEDVGIVRNSAGTLRISDGSTGYGSLFANSFTATSTTGTSTFAGAFIASGSIDLFGGGTKTTATALCIQLTGSADLCDGNDATGAGGSSNWLYQNGRLSPSTTVGIGIFASSTIGDGTGAGGLTISGGATTTGNALIMGNLGVGANTNGQKFSVGTPETLSQSNDLAALYNDDFAYLSFRDTANDVETFLGADTSNGFAFYSATNHPITFGTGNMQRMRLGVSGGLSLGDSFFSSDAGMGSLIVEGSIGVGTTSTTSAKLAIDNTAVTIGSELITNGTFTGSEAPWSLGDCAAYGTNNVTVVNTACTNQNLSTTFETEAGKTYLITFTLQSVSSTTVYYYVDNATQLNYRLFGSGVHTEAFVSDYTGTETITFESWDSSNGNNTWTIDDVSIKEVQPISPSLLVAGYDGTPWLKLGDDVLDNTALGRGALTSNSNGTGNTAVGSDALNSLESANYNSAFGAYALLSNATAVGNSAFGYSSLLSNTEGSVNTAMGYVSLYSNSTGSYNSAFGGQALTNNRTGYQNTAVGGQSLTSNTSGYSNTGIGLDALYYNTVGYQNTAVGVSALQSNLGNNNVALGYSAGWANTGGEGNINIGANPSAYSSGITSGSKNILIGYDIGAVSQTASGQLNIQNIIFGTDNIATGSVLSSGNIGIGSTTPSRKLTVAGDIYTLNNISAGSSTLGYASSTALTVSGNTVLAGLSDGCLSTVSGLVTSSGSPCGSGGGSSNWLYQNGRLSPSTTVGIFVGASSTIGDGTGAGGLTIDGGATTTGNHFISGALTVTGNTTLAAATSTSFSTGVLTATGNTTLGSATSSVLRTTTLGVGSDYLADITGSGLTITGNTLAVATSTFFTNSAQFAQWLSDETGTGNVVFSASPVLTGTTAFGSITVSGSSTLGYASSTALTVSGNTFLNTLTATGNTSLAAATSTNFNATSFGVGSDYITDLTGSGLSIVSGALTAAGDGVSDWKTQNSALTPSTTIGIVVNASSTIGNGTATGGLTISGGATTTGNMYVAGNVGIGSTSPTQKLSVVGNGLITGGLGVGITEASAGNITATGRITSALGDVRSGGASGDAFYMLLGTNNWDWFHADTADKIQFRRNSVALFTLDSTGKVGIGTTSPTNMLSVQGGNFWLGGNFIGTGTINIAGSIQGSGLTLTGSSTLGYASSTALTVSGNTILANATSTSLSTGLLTATGNVTLANATSTSLSTGLLTTTGAFTATGNTVLANATSTSLSTGVLTATGNTTLGSATSTVLRTTTLGVGSDYITDITGTGLSVVNGVLTATDSSVSNWKTQNGALTPSTTIGIVVNASSTIGNGTGAGGLTISGGATTTGNAYFGGKVAIGAVGPTSSANTLVDIIGATGIAGASPAEFFITNGANTAGNAPNIIGRFGRSSTLGFYSATQADDQLFFLGGRGYGTTGWGTQSNAAIAFTASQAWTDSNHGTYLSFYTTPNNSVTRAEVLRIGQEGSVMVGTTTTAGKFTVWGADTSATTRLAHFVNSASSSLLTVFNDGKVGIGSSTPSRLLTVQGGDFWLGGNLTGTGTINSAGVIQGSGLALTGSSTLAYASSTALTVSGNSFFNFASSSYASTTGLTATNATFGNSILGNATSTNFNATSFGVGSDYITDITGSGLTITGNTLAVATSTFFTNSSQFAQWLSDETGTGNVVFSASPVLTGTTAFGSITVSGSSTLGYASSTALTVSGNAYFGNIFATGTLMVGTTTYSGVAGEAYASFFTAASTTATSTFAGNLNIGSGGIVYDASTTITSISNLEFGNLSFDTDAGMVQWVDLPVLNAATGTVESYSAAIGGNSILTVYGESTGSGAANALRVGIGTTTPVSTLFVQGTSTDSIFTLASESGTKVLNVLSNGKVGIGSTTPSRLLTVAGDAYFLNNIFAASSTLGYASSTALTVSGNTILGAATSTNFNATTFGIGTDYITDLTGSGLSIVGGALTATGGGSSNWLYQNGRLSPSTTVGIGIFASSTIGNGTGSGGLTISGGATTTGNAYFGGNVAIGTTTHSSALTVAGDNYFGGTTYFAGDTNTDAGSMVAIGGYGSSSDYSILEMYTEFQSDASDQYPVAFWPTIRPNANLTSVQGITGLVTLASSSKNITNVFGMNVGIGMNSSYTGKASYGIGVLVADPATTANPLLQWSGFAIGGITNGNGTTTGQIDNSGVNVAGVTAASAGSATVNNSGVAISLPSGSPAGGTTNNYGLNIYGNGGTSAGGTVNNYSIYNGSTAKSYFAGVVGLGSTTPEGLLTLSKSSITGATVAGIKESLRFTNSTQSAVYYGDNAYIVNAPTATSTLVGKIIRIEDNSQFGNTVRGLEVQAHRGTTTRGENTGISAFGRTFGLRGTTEGDAGDTFIPAGVYAETRGTTQGNALRAYSGTITTTALAYLFQDSSTFSGTGLLMNFGNAGGSFAATSSAKFLDFQNGGTSKFTVTAAGTTTIGDGTTANMAGLQIGYGGLCVDNDGSCTASTTGRITSVSSALGNSDLAEIYFSSDDLVAGDIVMADGGLSVARADRDQKSLVLGVVSTKPGLLLGHDDHSLRTGESGYPVALKGRVPIRLSTENGPIEKGDRITLSSIAGIGMKATQGDMVVGIALEDFDGGRAYTDGYFNQFGDDLVKARMQPLNQNTDARTQDGCSYGAGNEQGATPCVKEAVSKIAPTTVSIDTKTTVLNELRAEVAETMVTEDGEEVTVGQALMFVDLAYYPTPTEQDVLTELVSTTSRQVNGRDETLWDRLKILAENFVDGVLKVAGVRTNELCVGKVCVDEETFLRMVQSASVNGSDTGSGSTTEEPPQEEVIGGGDVPDTETPPTDEPSGDIEVPAEEPVVEPVAEEEPPAAEPEVVVEEPVVEEVVSPEESAG